MILNQLPGSKSALSNQNAPCCHIRYFCDVKVFAVATIERNMLQNSNLVVLFTMKKALGKTSCRYI